MPRDVCAISEDLSPDYVTAYAYDDSGNLFRARVYQQCGRDKQVAINVGRYISSDPIGIVGGLNTFGYVGQNPVNWSDSLGLDTFMMLPPRYLTTWNQPGWTPESVRNTFEWWAKNDTPGYVSIAAHGGPDQNNNYALFNGVGKAKDEYATAALIAGNPLFKGMPVILDVCNSGAGGSNSFAAKLSKLLFMSRTNGHLCRCQSTLGWDKSRKAP